MVGGLDVEYHEKLKIFFDELGIAKKMVLATSSDDIVSARTVSVLAFDEKLYFQTDIAMDKAKDIMNNSKVALAAGNIQIKGNCKEVGHPLDENNEKFLNYFKEYYSSAYAKYSHLHNERVYEITPTLIKLWTYKEESPCIEFFDCNKQEYNLIKYEI